MLYEKEQALLEHYNKHPNGGTTIRDKQLLRIAFDLAGIQPEEGDLVLDLGCASGVMANNVSEMYKVNVVGVDSASSRIAIGKKDRPDIDYVCMDIHEFLDTTNLTFDYIMLFDTIEHMYKPEALIANAKEVLKEGGSIISKTPLNFPYEAHLQVYETKAEFDEQLDPTRSIAYGQSVIAVWE